MSERYQAIAVQAEPARVRTALDEFAQSLGGRAQTISSVEYDAPHLRGSPTTFFLYRHEDWTVLEAGFGLMPALAVHLSQDIQTDVFCLDCYSTVGYEHFSLLHAGELIYLFTFLDDYLEMHGVDPAKFVASIQPGEYEIVRGDDPLGVDFQHYAFGIFRRFIAPFDLEEFFWNNEDTPLECVHLDLPFPASAKYQLGGIGPGPDGLAWKAVLDHTWNSGPRVTPPQRETAEKHGLGNLLHRLRTYWIW